MAKNKSAGILLYRWSESELEVFLVHPGGPFWAAKDDGAWSLPKGEFTEGEDPLAAAKREFQEETGCEAEGDFIALTPRKQRSGKLIYAWAVRGECDAQAIKSNTFTMEWPRRSGNYREFPEVDRAAWFGIPQATEKLLPGQRGFLQELLQRIGNAGASSFSTPPDG